MSNPKSIRLFVLIVSVVAMAGCVPAPPGMDIYALQTHQVTPFTTTGVPLRSCTSRTHAAGDTGSRSCEQNTMSAASSHGRR